MSLIVLISKLSCLDIVMILVHISSTSNYVPMRNIIIYLFEKKNKINEEQFVMFG